MPPPAGLAWRRCNWLGIGVQRFSRQQARASGTRCARWALTTTISAILRRWNSTKFLATTDGAGVDVVLNSLAGEFIDASLRLLVRGGRFIEMGKTDPRDPQLVATEHRGVRYRAFDLIEAGPEGTATMLAELMALFAAGALVPLPVKGFDVRCASAAYRFVSQARQIGKVVLTLPDGPGNAVLAGSDGGLAGGSVLSHRGYRDGRFGAGRSSGGSLRGGACGVGQPRRCRCRRYPGIVGRPDRRRRGKGNGGRLRCRRSWRGRGVDRATTAPISTQGRVPRRRGPR